jgi:hypothetical protein
MRSTLSSERGLVFAFGFFTAILDEFGCEVSTRREISE